jgi:hypothetical protein
VLTDVCCFASHFPLCSTAGECERFVTSLKTNKHLIELDLSENLIGTAEVSVCFRFHVPFTVTPFVKIAICVLAGGPSTFLTHCWLIADMPVRQNLPCNRQNLNTVMPDLVTGGEALADLLRSEGCNLKSLKLGAWPPCCFLNIFLSVSVPVGRPHRAVICLLLKVTC